MDTTDYETRVRELVGRLEAIYKRREREAWIFGFLLGFLIGIAAADLFG